MPKGSLSFASETIFPSLFLNKSHSLRCEWFSCQWIPAHLKISDTHSLRLRKPRGTSNFSNHLSLAPIINLGFGILWCTLFPKNQHQTYWAANLGDRCQLRTSHRTGLAIDFFGSAFWLVFGENWGLIKHCWDVMGLIFWRISWSWHILRPFRLRGDLWCIVTAAVHARTDCASGVWRPNLDRWIDSSSFVWILGTVWCSMVQYLQIIYQIDLWSSLSRRKTS